MVYESGDGSSASDSNKRRRIIHGSGPDQLELEVPLPEIPEQVVEVIVVKPPILDVQEHQEGGEADPEEDHIVENQVEPEVPAEVPIGNDVIVQEQVLEEGDIPDYGLVMEENLGEDMQWMFGEPFPWMLPDWQAPLLQPVVEEEQVAEVVNLHPNELPFVTTVGEHNAMQATLAAYQQERELLEVRHVVEDARFAAVMLEMAQMRGELERANRRSGADRARLEVAADELEYADRHVVRLRAMVGEPQSSRHLTTFRWTRGPGRRNSRD